MGKMLRDMNASAGGRRDSTSSFVGILASEIPTGFERPAFLLNDVDPEFPDRLYSMEILTLPSAGALFVGKAGEAVFQGAPAGTYAGTQRINKFDPGLGLVSSEETAYSLTLAPGSENAAPTAPGTIPNITGTAGVAITPVNTASAFSDTDTLTYSKGPTGTSWPAGMSINSSTGVISGTLAQSTTTGLRVRATDTAGQPVDSNPFSITIAAASVEPPASTVTGVTVSPSTATGSQQFTAIVNGTNSPSQAGTWSKAGGGTLSASGLFTEPAKTNAVQTITITFTSTQDPSKSGSATVTIAAATVTPPAPTVTGVSLTPANAVVDATTQQYAWAVAGTNSPPQTVNLTTTLGSINSAGLLTRPAKTNAIQTGSVTAASTLDPNVKETVSFTVPALVVTPPVDPVIQTCTVSVVLGEPRGPAANLSDIMVSLHAATGPHNSGTALYQSATESTDSQGVLTFTFPASVIAPGATALLSVLMPDGRHFLGVVEVD